MCAVVWSGYESLPYTLLRGTSCSQHPRASSASCTSGAGLPLLTSLCFKAQEGQNVSRGAVGCLLGLRAEVQFAPPGGGRAIHREPCAPSVGPHSSALRSRFRLCPPPGALVPPRRGAGPALLPFSRDQLPPSLATPSVVPRTGLGQLCHPLVVYVDMARGLACRSGCSGRFVLSQIYCCIQAQSLLFMVMLRLGGYCQKTHAHAETSGGAGR